MPKIIPELPVIPTIRRFVFNVVDVFSTMVFSFLDFQYLKVHSKKPYLKVHS